MIASYLTGTTITPIDAISWCGNSYYKPGVGTYWSYSRQRPIILGVGLSHRPVIPTRYFRLYLKVIRSSVPKELGFLPVAGILLSFVV